LAGLEPFERQSRVAAAVQPRDRVADGGQHPLDLVLAPFVDGELDACAAQPAGARGRRRPVLELDPALELRERFLGGIAFDLGLVHLLDLVARVREPVCELAVVGE
jgi:hypothetical protein